MTCARSAHLCVATCLILLSIQPSSPVLARASRQAPAPDDQSLRGFRTALDGYVALRARVRNEVPPLQVTPNAQEIAQRSDAMARAITRVRQNAPRGQFFDAASSAAIRRSLAAAMAATDEAGVRALLAEDMTSFSDVKVHARYPVGFVLPTMPAVLLQVLPTLPPQLEYRFIGRALILRDIDAALILDYLPDAITAR